MSGRTIPLRVAAVLLLLVSSAPALAVELHTGLQLGYNGGTGGKADAMISEFAQGLPLRARLAIGYVSLDPGSPADARRIFINDATNGIPEESGRVWDFGFDLLYRMPAGPLAGWQVYTGPRYARFTGNFKFIGGNEDFDIVSHQWGWGLGLEGRFAMASRLDFVLGGGVDWYRDAELSGHDTTYAPDGEDINPREDYSFDDADAAIQQPGLEPRLLVGVAYRFGM